MTAGAPRILTTQGELNEGEHLNIVQGEHWARQQRQEVLNEAFVRQLHQRMFSETWQWAGEFRRSDKNIGVEWHHLGIALKKRLDGAHFPRGHASYPPEPSMCPSLSP